MSVSTHSAVRLLRFASFELDVYAGELRKYGVKLRLQGQPVQVLAILLQAAGDLVTREELRRRVWQDDTFVDFDHALHNTVARIRDVLGDSAQSPTYIETLPRRGYRFIAQVERVQALEEAQQSISDESGDDVNETTGIPAPAIPRAAKGRGLMLALIACGTISVAVGFAFRHLHDRSAERSVRSVAVLPLQNLSGDPSQEYFADGMTDELITEMSRIQALRVVSHTSVMEYKGTRKHLPQIARELGVNDIVEGSIVREGCQVRITVQLLDGPNDSHLWGEDYQRPLQSILNLQREIARAISQQVRVKLISKPQTPISLTRPVRPWT